MYVLPLRAATQLPITLTTVHNGISVSWVEPTNVDVEYYVVELYQGKQIIQPPVQTFSNTVVVIPPAENVLYNIVVKGSSMGVEVCRGEAETYYTHDLTPESIATAVIQQLKEQPSVYENMFDCDLSNGWWAGMVVLNMDSEAAQVTYLVSDVSDMSQAVFVTQGIVTIPPKGVYRVNAMKIADNATVATVYVTSDENVVARLNFGLNGSLGVQN